MTDAETAAAVEDLRAFGADEATVAAFLAARPKRAAEAFSVHPANVLTVRLMLAMQTQWDQQALSTMSKAILVKTGLKYDRLEPTARLTGLGEISPADYRRIQNFEAEALKAWSEARA